MKPAQMQLGKIAEVQLGITLRGVDASRNNPTGTHQLVRISDISDEGAICIREPKLIRLDEVSATRSELRAGDVLLAARGVRMTAAVFDGLFPAVAGGQFCIIRPDADRLLPAYLRWFLNLPSTQEALIARTRGTYIKSLPVGSLAELGIPVPSIGQQRVIATIHELRLREKHLMENLAARRAVLVDRTILQSLQS